MKNYEQKLLHYATAPRATAQKITQVVDGDLVDFWVGKLRGVCVKMGDQFKFKHKEDALNLARKFRQDCINEAKDKGLIDA